MPKYKPVVGTGSLITPKINPMGNKMSPLNRQAPKAMPRIKSVSMPKMPNLTTNQKLMIQRPQKSKPLPTTGRLVPRQMPSKQMPNKLFKKMK